MSGNLRVVDESEEGFHEMLTPSKMARVVRPPLKLPSAAVWAAIVLTAIAMAVLNLGTVFALEFLVSSKFDLMQRAVDAGGLSSGIAVLVLFAVSFALVATCLVHGIAPDAGGSGAPENKGWLNGCNTHTLFTKRNLCVRAVATIMANAAGYPVGREGPTVTMGSNIAYLICQAIAVPHAREWIDMQSGAPGALGNELFFSRAARVVCAVGGACGMAMIFDSPLGGILYMFEEMTSAAWPVELTFKAFVGCIICSSASYGLLHLCSADIRSFVIFEVWYGPLQHEYGWIDVPGFIAVSCLLGLVAPLHTKLCLKVLDWRKQIHSGPRLKKVQPWAKMADALLFAATCALVVSLVSMLGVCHVMPERGTRAELTFVRYDCPEGSYNPVASLLLTTSEGAVKRLFNRQNTGYFGLSGLLLSLLAYTLLNIGLTGIPVPSGNFTGTMLIGGLAGRTVAHLIIENVAPTVCPDCVFATPAIYAMVGSAAMLSSFKQMSIAVVMFILSASNNIRLAPPLMMAVTVSLLVSRLLGSRAFDEEQLLRKKIHILSAEPSQRLGRRLAKDLLDQFSDETALRPHSELTAVRRALKLCGEACAYLPVLDEGRKKCVGLVPRTRLEAALQAAETKSASSLHVGGLADAASIHILEDALAWDFYPLFAKAHARAACVVSASSGDFCGVLSRSGLAAAAAQLEEEEDSDRSEGAEEDEEAESEEDEEEEEDGGISRSV